MPVQYPSLSLEEQTERYQRIAKDTLFPISYALPGLIPNSSFQSRTLDNGYLCTFAYQADNNIAISSLHFTVSINALDSAIGLGGWNTCCVVSYSPTVYLNNYP